jgi:hypothetical protein
VQHGSNSVYGEDATTALSQVMEYADSAEKDELVRMLIKAGGRELKDMCDEDPYC